MKKIILISLLLFFSQSFTLVANNPDKNEWKKSIDWDDPKVEEILYEFYFGDLVFVRNNNPK